jgi:hypothetical protein
MAVREKEMIVDKMTVINQLTAEGMAVRPGGYPGAGYLGRDYFVNNITGSSTAGGTDWDDAMDEVSTAITASEAWRTGLATNNQFVRNRIFVQGTATAYTAITALPSYCDMIAIGAEPHGNGSGIARIGADSGTGEHGMNSTTADARGLYMYGFQFQAGASGYAFKMDNLFRSRIENCVFAVNGSPAGAPAGAFVADILGGVILKDCKTLNASSKGNDFTLGLDVTGTHFHGNVIDGCFFSGATAAFRLDSTCVNSYHSIVKNSYFGWGSETCAIGVDDNSTDGHTIFANCFTFATDDYQMANNGTGRIIGCYAANALAT